MTAPRNTPQRPKPVEQQPTTPVTLRPMVDSDIDAVMMIESEVRNRPWTRAMFVDDLGRPSRRWLVAVPVAPGEVAPRRIAAGDPVPVGFGGIMLAGHELHVMDIAVDPAFQGQGIGGHLLARLLVTGLDLGASSATLEVAADNESALNLYRRLGFAAEGRRPHYYQGGVDAIIMWVRDLDAVDRRRRLNEMAGVDDDR